MKKCIIGVTKIMAVLFTVLGLTAFCGTECYAADVSLDPATLQNVQQELLNQQLQMLAAANQQAFNDQYAKALLVYSQAQINQQNALQQTYMLAAVQNMQNAQFNSLLSSNNNIDYKSHLAEVYAKYQQYGLNAYAGYEGLK